MSWEKAEASAISLYNRLKKHSKANSNTQALIWYMSNDAKSTWELEQACLQIMSFILLCFGELNSSGQISSNLILFLSLR